MTLPYFTSGIMRRSLYSLIMVMTICGHACYGSGYFQHDNEPVPFGMRLRSAPATAKKIHEPVLIREAPGNEATMVSMPDGSLAIFFVNRPGRADKLMSISSADGGLTWDEPRTILDLPGQAYYANQVIVDRNGELHCVFHLFDKGDNGYRGRHLNLWYARTENQRQHWTTPRKIYNGYVGSLRGMIQLQSGRLLLAFGKAVPSREKAPSPGTVDYGWNEVISMYSDDGGETWHFSANALNIANDKPSTTRYGAVEPSLIELNNGRGTWMLIRTRLGHLYEASSTDGGATWQDATATSFISSDSPATTLRLSDGNIVLFWCSNQRWDDPRSYALGGRQVLHGAISSDEGKTWKGFREVLIVPPLNTVRGDRGTAYPSAVETKDGKIALVSGQGEGQRAIAMLDPAWLEETSQYDDFRKGLTQWTLFGADSLTGLGKLPGSRNRALHIRKSMANDTQAVWNFPMTAHGELDLEIRKNGASKGIQIALTDHFSIAGDTAASRHAVVRLQINERDWSDNEKATSRIKVTWNTTEGKAIVSVNGKRLNDIPFQRHPGFGLNYLRLGIPSVNADPAGFYVKSIRFRSLQKQD